jgi:hypothetical protein
MNLYLGGKMIGVPEFGAELFNDAAAQLRALGHEVFNPVDHDTDVGFNTAGLDGTWEDMTVQGFDRRKALAFDMAWIAEHSEGMVALDNWADSPGARAEVAFHQALFLPVWELDDFLAEGVVAAQVSRLIAWRPRKLAADYVKTL